MAFPQFQQIAPYQQNNWQQESQQQQVSNPVQPAVWPQTNFSQNQNPQYTQQNVYNTSPSVWILSPQDTKEPLIATAMWGAILGKSQ